METLLYYIPAGAIAGLIAGLLGLGGGVVIVPALVIIFPLLGIPAEPMMHLIIGTSLATIVPTSVSSVIAHYRRGAVDWQIFRSMAPWMLFGAIAGGEIAHLLPSDVLQKTFSIFVLFAASQMFRSNRPHESQRQLSGQLINGSIGQLALALMGAITAEHL